MSLSIRQLYEFGEFRLDPFERILMRGGVAVELTPKGFELLCVLVENHGRLLGKDELMDKIWADSFVEESNLTFNIRQLRIVLGDDAHRPKFIKTVRRHGYRFIADVKQISEDGQPKAQATPAPLKQPPQTEGVMTNDLQPAEISLAEQPFAPPKFKKYLIPILAVCTVLLISAFVVGWWYARGQSGLPILNEPFSSEKISTNGKVTDAALSPDGKNVVYTIGKDTEKESVWIRQIESGSNIEIIPRTDNIYTGLTFSPDGQTLYFVRRPRLSEELFSIYRVSIFGGIPQKIINSTEGWISISPDGSKISFVRQPRRDDENASLWIADSADGANERKLVTRPPPFRIADNEFSPDGKRIVFAAGQSENEGNEFGLSEVNLETGTERELTSEKFFVISQLTHLPDQSGWLITASRVPNINLRIWQVSAATGEVVALTKDSETYGILSLDKAATKLVSTQIKQDFHLRLINLENPTDSRILTDANSVTFAPDGKIYFSSIMSGNNEIWSINTDGSSQRQITNSKWGVSSPVVSPDNGSVFFASNRSGVAHVWRMNTDGSNQTQITRKEGGFPMFVSPDGEWVYYHHGINRTLWRVSVKTGEEQLVLNKAKTHFAISPDGSQVTYSETQGDERILTITALADEQTVKTFHLADKKSIIVRIAWMPDGKNLIYITSNRDYGNNVLWKQSLAEDAPRQIVALGDEELRSFALPVSPDGKTFALVQGRWLHDAVLLKGLK